MEWSKRTDDELIRESRSGNHDAFREIVRRYEDRVAATVIGMMGSGPEAEDVGQEVFIRFYKHLNQFRGDAKLATYLTRIAINLSLNALRRRKRNRLIFWDQSVESEISNHSSVSHDPYDEEKEIVQKAILQLEPSFRSIVVLRIIEGYSTREAAKMLGIPEGTVLSRLARAQKKLKELLTPYFGVSHEQENFQSAASLS
jgi:RNA polymerase sigma-70 factor (ECF subfamily)